MSAAKNDAEDVAQSILDLIFDMRSVTSEIHPSRVLSRQRESNVYHLSRVQRFVEKREPVQMILPAFPAKSPNRNKTFGVQPDFGEVLALRRLQKLCDEIREIYEPGAVLTVCSDGRVFSDIVRVADADVSEYTRAITAIVLSYELDSIHTFSLDDAFCGHGDFESMRETLLSQYAETIESIRSAISTSLEERNLFNGMHRFLFEDLMALEPGLSRSQARERSKQATYQLLQRSHAWSRFVEERFEGAIRLSIHPQSIQSRKIGIRLLPSDNFWRTPWHSVVLFDGQHYRLTTRIEAERAGAVRMKTRDGYEVFVGLSADVLADLEGGSHVAHA